MALKTSLVETPSERQAAYALRHDVYVLEQGVPVELEIDEHDETDARHFAVWDGGEVIATARLVPLGDAMKFGRLAVQREYRGQGISSQLLQTCLYHAFGNPDIKRVILDAQLDAMRLYRRAGFVEAGEQFMEAGIPHQRMRLNREIRNPSQM